MTEKHNPKLAVFTLSLLLAACGGGGSSSSGGGSGSSSSGGNSNNPPAFTSGPNASTPEGQAATGYAATASDPDGDSLTFSLAGGPDEGTFSIDSVSGALSFIEAPDFENPGDSDADNDYEIEVEVTDGNGGTARQSLVVSVADVSQLEMEVSYPTPNANLGGVSQTTVTGNLIDVEDGIVELDDVSFISVNDTPALQDPDNPGRWSVQVPVAPLRDTLAVSVEWSDGSTDSASLALDNQTVWVELETLALDTANNRALVIDPTLDALIAVDLASGDRTIVSDASTGSGPAFSGPQGVTLDAANGRALVTDYALDALIAVDLASGDRIIVSDNSSGSSPAFSTPQDVTLDADNDRVLVIDRSDRRRDTLIAVDLASGDRTIFSDASIGGGPGFSDLEDVILDTAKNRALVIDGGSRDALIAVNLATGERTIISDDDPNTDGDASDEIGSGPGFQSPTGVTLDAANDRALVVDRFNRNLVAVDLANGNRTIISDNSTGSGPAFDWPQGVTLDAANDRALVIDLFLDTLVAVDLASGDRTVVSGVSTGSGMGLPNPRGMTLDTAANRALVVDVTLRALLAVDLGSGDRTIVSDKSTGLGPDFIFPQDVVLDAANNRALVIDEESFSGSGDFRRALIAVDLASGDRAILSDDSTGGGPNFSKQTGLALDAANDRALVIDDDLDALIAVDLTNGDRAIVSDDSTGGGRGFSRPRDIALDAANDRALVIDTGYNTHVNVLFAVDLASGDRTIISGDSTGGGPDFNPQGLALDAANDRVLVVDRALDALVAVDLASGDRTILSGDSIGSGPSFSHWVGDEWRLALDAANDRVLLIDRYHETLFVVELSSGDRAVASR